MAKTNEDAGKGDKNENLLPVDDAVLSLLKKHSSFNQVVKAVSELDANTKIMLGAHGHYKDTRFFSSQIDANSKKIIDYQRLALLLAAIFKEAEPKVPQIPISLIVCYGGRSSVSGADPLISPSDPKFLLDSLAFKLMFLLVDRYKLATVRLTARTGAVRFNQDTGSAETETEELLQRRIPALEKIDTLQRKLFKEKGKAFVHLVANKIERWIEKNGDNKNKLDTLRNDINIYVRALKDQKKKFKIEGLAPETNTEHDFFLKGLVWLINDDKKALLVDAIVSDLTYIMLLNGDRSFVKHPLILEEETPSKVLVEMLEEAIGAADKDASQNRSTAAKYGKFIFTYEAEKYHIMDVNKKKIFKGSI